MSKFCQFVFAFGFFWAAVAVVDGKSIAKLPSYIHICKVNDPQINDCFKKFFESIKSKFTTGIPELNIPQIDPLKKDIVSFNLPGDGNDKVECTDITIMGLKNMQIQEISINPKTYQLKMKVTIPEVRINGKYEIDAKILNMVLKGRGPFEGNATDVFFDTVAEGKLIDENGTKFVKIANADGQVSWKKHYIKIDHLFPDKNANEAFNNLVNGPAGASLAKKEMPVVKNVIIHSIIGSVNAILERIPFDAIYQ